ncbi:MAG: MFS transporter [Gammaproteobacteria bacterium]|jgi:glycoside/pentoside/hexuronide:cation symporter, GPH family|nr:MFS transporter [Gammaproteobacteria bacterium]MBT7370491.1 MFS transporter [Gammaproteobacteria bacterium]
MAIELPTITRSRAWIYGSLGFPIAMLGYPLGPYIPRLYSTEMGISLTLIGLVITGAAIFDAITDPVMGHFSDRWRTRWGRRRPWIVLGVPLWAGAVWMLLNPSVGVTVTYLAFFYLMMRASSTILGLPYVAWGLELSSNYHTRTMIQSVREKYVLAGLVTSALIIAFSEEIFGRAEASFVLSNFSLVVLVLVPLSALLVVSFVPEVPTYNAPTVSLKDGLKMMYKNKLFFRLLMIELLIAGGENFRNTLSLLFIQDYIGLPNVGRALMLYFGSGLLAIPFWDWLARRFGKHQSLASAMVLVSIVSIGVLTVTEGQITRFYVLFSLKGFCFGAFAYLPRAMLADVVDLDTIRSGTARPASYFALLGFITKCAASFGGLSLPILAFIGYSTDPGITNGTSELMWLGALYGIVPTVVFVFAFYLSITWPLNATMHTKVERILAKKYERQMVDGNS